MAISITVCGQSNALGQWRNASDTGPFPSEGKQWPLSWLNTNPTTPRANDPDVQGNAVWPYVAQLLYERHGLKVKFWNAARSNTSLMENWNGRNVAQGNLGGGFTITGNTITAVSGNELSVFSDGEVIRVRDATGVGGEYTVSGTPTGTSLTISETFPGTYSGSGVRVHGGDVSPSDGGFDPNSYYSTALTAFETGTHWDARYVLAQWGNNDFLLKQTQQDIQQELGYFRDYWRAAGADGILLGGTLLGTTDSGTTFDNGMTYMHNAWLPACETLVAAASDVYLGAQMGSDVDWDATGYYKADNVHWDHKMHYVAAEAWYRAIAAMLGYTPSAAGAVDLTNTRKKYA